METGVSAFRYSLRRSEGETLSRSLRLSATHNLLGFAVVEGGEHVDATQVFFPYATIATSLL